MAPTLATERFNISRYGYFGETKYTRTGSIFSHSYLYLAIVSTDIQPKSFVSVSHADGD